MGGTHGSSSHEMNAIGRTNIGVILFPHRLLFENGMEGHIQRKVVLD